jgi:peptide/nickel transport system substrate-binding protein
MLNKKMTHRVIKVTVVSLLIATVLAGCALIGGNRDSSSQSDGGEAAADTSARSGREAGVAGASDEDRTLIVAVSQDLSTLDWDASGAFPRMTETQVNVLGSWAQPAIVEHEDGSMTGDALNFEPMLAGTMVISLDGTQWTFRLPSGMKHYPSGNEITTHDYLYYKDRRGNMSVPPSLDRLVRLATEEEPLKGFEVLNDYTFRFNASDWTPILRPFMSCCQFGYIIDSKAYMDAGEADGDKWGQEFAKTNMPSSGPYYIHNRIPNELMEFRTNPNWQGKEPFFNRILFTVVPESADRVLLLKAGTVDMAQDLSAKEINDLRSDSNVQIKQVRIGDMIVMPINHNTEPFNDKRVRQALAHLIPYDDIVGKVWYDSAERSYGPVPSMVPGYDHSYWPYDLPEEEALAKAKQLLAEAGYADGLAFDLNIDLGTPEQVSMAKIIQGELAKAGISVTINPMPRAAYQEGKNNGTHTSALDTLFPWVAEPGYFMDILLGCASYGNRYSGVCLEEADELIRQAGTTVDEDERFRLYSEAQRLHIDNASWIWLGARYFNLAIGSDIAGYVAFPDTRTRYWHLYRDIEE